MADPIPPYLSSQDEREVDIQRIESSHDDWWEDYMTLWIKEFATLDPHSLSLINLVPWQEFFTSLHPSNQYDSYSAWSRVQDRFETLASSANEMYLEEIILIEDFITKMKGQF